MALALALAVYSVIGLGLLLATHRLTYGARGRWQRRAALSAVCALFFAPSAILVGEGMWLPLPALATLGQNAPGGPAFWLWGIAPIVVTFFVLLAVSSAWIKRRRANGRQ